MDAHRKKVILIILAALAGAVVLIALAWFIFFKGQFGTYNDDQYQFSIKYPRSWKLMKNFKEGVPIAFVKSKESSLDVLQENFNVTVQEVPAKIASLESFSKRIKEQLTGIFGTNIRFIEDKPIQVGQRRGYKIMFEAEKPDHLLMINIWTIKKDKAYILTFLGDLRRFKQLSVLVDEVINSFNVR